MKTTNPYLAPALRSLLSDTRRTFTPIEAIVLHEAADALEAASAKPTPAAQPAACEHDWSGPYYRLDGEWAPYMKCWTCGAQEKIASVDTSIPPVLVKPDMGIPTTEKPAPSSSARSAAGEADKPLTTEEEDKIAQGIRRHEPLAEKNATCSRCGGAGWVWRHELDSPGEHDGTDDTRYSCPRCAEKNATPFVRMKMPNIWPSDFAAEDQDGGKDYDEGFADGQESMRNRCIAALRAQGIEVIEDRKPTEQYRFSVDGKTYTHPSARISVPQILMYAHLTGDSSATPPIGPHTLYRVIDAFPDQQLRPDERVDLTLGQVTKFISVPPGIMGG